jgi:hypothetical protein
MSGGTPTVFGESTALVAYLYVAIALVLCAALVWIAGVRGARDLRPRERVLEIAGLPARLDGLRVLHLTDLHLRERTKLPARLLGIARQYRPDLVVITGDLVWGPSGVGVAQALLRALAAEFPTWAVEGNADHWADRTGEERARWRQTGARFLTNAAAPLAEGSPPAWIVGVDDPYRGLDDLEAAYGDVPAGAWTMLLAHSPDILSRDLARRARLIFAGHTHGGQCRLPLLGAVVTHTRIGRRFVEGVHTVGDTVVVISRGAGVTRLPIRLLCPAEVTTWRLTRA